MRLGRKIRTTAWTEIPHSLKSQRKRCGGSPSLFPLAMLLQEGHFFVWCVCRILRRLPLYVGSDEASLPCRNSDTLYSTQNKRKTLWTGEAYLKSNQCKGGNKYIKSCTRDDRSVCSNYLSNGKGKGESKNTLENSLVVENKCRAARTVQDCAIKWVSTREKAVRVLTLRRLDEVSCDAQHDGALQQKKGDSFLLKKHRFTHLTKHSLHQLVHIIYILLRRFPQ